jgi:hypothetical protein
MRNKTIIEINRTKYELEGLRDTYIPEYINRLTDNEAFKKEIFEVVMEELSTKEDKKYFKDECTRILEFLKDRE